MFTIRKVLYKICQTDFVINLESSLTMSCLSKCLGALINHNTNYWFSHWLSLEGIDFWLFFTRLSKTSDLFCNREKGNIGCWIFQKFFKSSTAVSFSDKIQNSDQRTSMFSSKKQSKSSSEKHTGCWISLKESFKNYVRWGG